MTWPREKPSRKKAAWILQSDETPPGVDRHRADASPAPCAVSGAAVLVMIFLLQKQATVDSNSSSISEVTSSAEEDVANIESAERIAQVVDSVRIAPAVDSVPIRRSDSMIRQIIHLPYLCHYLQSYLTTLIEHKESKDLL